MLQDQGGGAKVVAAAGVGHAALGTPGSEWNAEQSRVLRSEFSSDLGPQFKANKFQKFLKQYGVRHRLSSAYFPHSNSRARRLLRDNMGNDKFLRALLQYRNTPHPDTRLSPA